MSKFKVGDLVRVKDGVPNLIGAGKVGRIKEAWDYGGYLIDFGGPGCGVGGEPSVVFDVHHEHTIHESWLAKAEPRVGDRMLVIECMRYPQFNGQIVPIVKVQEYGSFNDCLYFDPCDPDQSYFIPVRSQLVPSCTPLSNPNQEKVNVSESKNVLEPREVSLPVSMPVSYSPSEEVLKTVERIHTADQRTVESLYAQNNQLRNKYDRLMQRFNDKRQRFDQLQRDYDDKVAVIGRLNADRRSAVARYMECEHRLMLTDLSIDALKRERDDYRRLYEEKRGPILKVREGFNRCAAGASDVAVATAHGVKRAAVATAKSPVKLAGHVKRKVARSWGATNVKAAVLAAVGILMLAAVPATAYMGQVQWQHEVAAERMTVPTAANPNDPREQAWLRERAKRAEKVEAKLPGESDLLAKEWRQLDNGDWIYTGR